MKASVNAVTIGAKVRDTAGRLKAYAVTAQKGLLSISMLEQIQLATSVTPATKLHEVIVVNKPEDGDMESRPTVKILRFELLDVARAESITDIKSENYDSADEAKAQDSKELESVDLKERSDK